MLTEEAKPFAALPIVAQAFEKLRCQLPENLHYHNLEHVIDVFNEVIAFGLHDALPRRSLELLAIAAVFHDMGFIERGQENESLGARDAIAAMQQLGKYSPEEIELVSTMILDTQVRATTKGFIQVPTTELSKYLCDADVSNLGRDDFFEKAELVRLEIGAPNPETFGQGLKKFMASHRWYSPGAKTLRQAQKDANSAELLRRFPH